MNLKNSQETHEVILSIFFNTNGFGYVLMNEPTDAIKKGIKSFKPVESPKLWEELINMIHDIKPERIVLENEAGSKTHKGKRITKLIKRLKLFLEGMGMPYASYDREQIRMVFELWHARSKYDIAIVISKSLPAFQNYLHNKPKYPKTEHYRTVLYDAAALGITHYYVTG